MAAVAAFDQSLGLSRHYKLSYACVMVDGRGGATMEFHTRVRHESPPEPNACRWCGVLQESHGHQWTPAKRWHLWEAPTPAQRKARMLWRRAHRASPIKRRHAD
ncbi:hypothetical protein CS0771_02190 [Catellatospora sp. IY07-71]|nr:hypothetical protein CS0771_02190 [Catellatospora sp. IY07-71]